jgi:hypothetical protein
MQILVLASGLVHQNKVSVLPGATVRVSVSAGVPPRMGDVLHDVTRGRTRASKNKIAG